MGKRFTEPRYTLAVQTGDLRGAFENNLALTRSCAGQRNLPLKSLPSSMLPVFAARTDDANRILSCTLQLLSSLYVTF